MLSQGERNEQNCQQHEHPKLLFHSFKRHTLLLRQSLHHIAHNRSLIRFGSPTLANPVAVRRVGCRSQQCCRPVTVADQHARCRARSCEVLSVCMLGERQAVRVQMHHHHRKRVDVSTLVVRHCSRASQCCWRRVSPGAIQASSRATLLRARSRCTTTRQDRNRSLSPPASLAH